jgi:hypothetical protein
MSAFFVFPGLLPIRTFAVLLPRPYNFEKQAGQGGDIVNKDRILEAANAIQNGSDASNYHDELEVIIGLIMDASDLLIAAVVRDISTDSNG